VPKSAPAKTLWALRIGDLKAGAEERLPLSCLQGLVNPRQSEIFLAYDSFDQHWLGWLRERSDVNEVRWVGRKYLLDKFLPVVKSLVVTDPDVPATINVATIIAPARHSLNFRNSYLPASCMFQCVAPQLMLVDDWVSDVDHRADGPGCARHFNVGHFEWRLPLRVCHRFAWRSGQPQGIGDGKVVSEDSLRRTFKDQPAPSVVHWQTEALLSSYAPAWEQPWIAGLDVTAKSI